MEKLLYINNYNCSIQKREQSPDNHLWGIDRLASYYDVTCAKIPHVLFKRKFKGSAYLDNLYKSFVLLFRYYRYPVVYAACGELTTAFAFANRLHLGKRRLYKIQHHGGRKIFFSDGYTKILFISKFVASKYNIKNKINVNWGGA